MELRSSRSRSKTPLMEDSFSKEFTENIGNRVEKSVVRTTRRTTIIKTNEGATSSTDDYSSTTRPVRRSARTEKLASSASLRKIYKTSDYSSEDGGENEVSSTKILSQNERNQLIEDARATANGNSEMSALDLYRKSGRYWEVYPKTDWTYSQHSKDRIEIAPGVVAMPNMSRKTIHSLDESNSQSLYSENVSHKDTNTESSFMSSLFGSKKVNTDATFTSSSSSALYGSKNVNSDAVFTSSASSDLYGAEVKSDAYASLRPKLLFNNNREDGYFKRHQQESRWYRFSRSVVSVFTTILTVFYFVYQLHASWFAHLHNLACRVMLLDTWLLWKTRPGNRTRKLVALCLIPLLLLGGWWLFSNVGSIVYGALHNYTSPSNDNILVAPSVESIVTSNNVDLNLKDISKVDLENTKSEQNMVEERIVKITEKYYIEPPSASEIASGLTVDQLELIALSIKNIVGTSENINTDELVQKIIASPSFQTVINNYNYAASQVRSGQDSTSINSLNFEMLKNQQTVIDSLVSEVQKLKDEMLLAEHLRQKDNARLLFQINKCCDKKPFLVNIEGYVNSIMTNLLNNPEFLRNQHGFKTWLHSLFVAKKDLESHLSNITANLDPKFATLVQDNTKIIMDKVAAKISEVQRASTSYNSEASGGSISLTDAHIKRIVKSALAIYDADKTGLVDYAMETIGGQIVTTRCTENYHHGKAVVSVLGIPLWYPVNSPRTVISPGVNPGECWAFQNFPGFIVIKLSNKVRLEAFSVEHISKLLVPEGKIDSALKEFEVYGLTSENDREPVMLGSYKYDYDGEPLQFFGVEQENMVFDMIEVRVISNHGNPNYTCLYRFRVHGKLYHGE